MLRALRFLCLALFAFSAFAWSVDRVDAHQTRRDSAFRAYFARRDRAAIALLEALHQTEGASRISRLALADLYFSDHRYPRARRELVRLSHEDPFEAIPLWVAWIDFAAGRSAAAERSLIAIIAASEQDHLAEHGALMLAWQLLMRGRAAAAADVLSVPRDASSPIDQQFRLLRGQALMFAGAFSEAESALRSVSATALRPDATRDLAWCQYLRGDRGNARLMLESILDSDDTGSSPLPVAWPSVLKLGPRVLGRGLRRAYRDRPRGQDPTQFLLTLADRNAAADARAMLEEFFAPGTDGTHTAESIREPAARVERGPGTQPVDEGAQRHAPLWVAFAILVFGVLSLVGLAVGARDRLRRTTSTR